MVYDFQDIVKKYPHIKSKALSVGRLLDGNRNIELPDNFDFSSATKPEPLKTVSKGMFFDTPKIQPKEWPANILYLKAKAIEGDKGLGDILEREIGLINSLIFKDWFKKTFGRVCACNWSKDTINRYYPINKTLPL